PTPTERALYDIGFSRIGPSFCAFVLHVLESCARLSIEDIYFVAREGHLFQRLFNLFQPRIRRLRETPPFRQHYIYLSRLSTSLPSVDTFGSRETLLGLWRAQPEGLDSILRAFSLNPEDFASLAASVGIADMRANAADPFTDPSYKAFFEHPEFQSRAGALRDEVRANLRDYLSSEQFFGARERKVFVDIGWNGTIQANLTRAFGADPDFPGLEGFFYGRHYSGYHDYYWNPKSLYHSGFAYDQLRPNADEEAVNHFIHLFELAAGAPHGATLGYRREPDGAVRPILRDHSQPPEVRRIQEGILDYAAEFADTYDLHEVDPAALQRNAARTLARFLLRPTMAEAKAIRSLVHDADWGSEKRFPLVVDGLGPLAWLRGPTPRRFAQGNRRALCSRRRLNRHPR
ncbi:MAG: hypothetical protein NTW86_24900, partial [Candidatus Sumerlaeota bacterium]|nr:hypothetical protein [Candidatus Sumerlaeota bacterium]